MDLKRTATLAGVLFSDSPVVVQEKQEQVTEAYDARLNEVQAKLDTLNQIMQNMSSVDRTQLNWGHVGDLARLSQQLQDILDVFS